MEDDTIVAIATPPGQGGLGVVRISGPASLDVARLLFPGLKRWRDRHVTFGHVVDANGVKVDEAMVTYMCGPRTYTGEDVVEISCHGSPYVLDRVVAAALEHGCRAARPGEFTLRAFLAGRIDLTQAEAIPDLVGATTEAGLGLALRQLGGALTHRVEPLRQRLLDVLAHATALVDFSEDDIPALDTASIARALEDADADLQRLLEGARHGVVLQHGVSLAIVGAPNVGKSSVLNGLLGRERAIVTPIAGTTRDTLEERVDIGGILFHVVDTAGITDTDDPVERIGVERSRAALDVVDIVLFVLDRSRTISTADRDICRAILDADRRVSVVVALNKSDLPTEADLSVLPQIACAAGVVGTSAVCGDGLDALRAVLREVALGGSPTDGFVVSNARHIDALREAREALQRAQTALAAGLPLDLVSFDLRAVIHALGEITGASVSDELLDRIFSRFCIGK